MAKVSMTADELAAATSHVGSLRGKTEDNTPLLPIRQWMVRLIGEVWRQRAKIRYQAQRIRDLEHRLCDLEMPALPAPESPRESTPLVLPPAEPAP